MFVLGTVFALVTATYSAHSPIVNCVTDKDNNCYYLAHRCMVRDMFIGNVLSLGDAVRFKVPSNQNTGRPIVIRHLEEAFRYRLVSIYINLI